MECFKSGTWAIEMAQWVGMLATKPCDLSLIHLHLCASHATPTLTHVQLIYGLRGRFTWVYEGRVSPSYPGILYVDKVGLGL